MQGIGFFTRAHCQARHRHQRRVWPALILMLIVMLRELTGLIALAILIGTGLLGMSTL